MYGTPAQLISGQGALREVSEIFDLEAALVTATVEDTDRSAWSVDEIAAADAALAEIVATSTRASSEMDVYLARRGYDLPLDAEQFPVLTTWWRSITRYHLQMQRDRTSEDTGRIERDYRQALSALKGVAAGELSLGAGDPLVGVTSGDSASVQVASGGPRLFSRNTLKGL